MSEPEDQIIGNARRTFDNGVGALVGQESGKVTLTTRAHPKAPFIMHAALSDEGDAGHDEGRLYGPVDVAVPAADGSYLYPAVLRFDTPEAAEAIAALATDVAALMRQTDPHWS